MKVNIELDCTPEEFKEMFVPSEKQHEFITMTYDAYVTALQKMIAQQIDPYQFLNPFDKKS
jgi:hypothetical protein